LTRLRNGVKNELFYSISLLLSSSQASDIIKWCRLKDPTTSSTRTVLFHVPSETGIHYHPNLYTSKLYNFTQPRYCGSFVFSFKYNPWIFYPTPSAAVLAILWFGMLLESMSTCGRCSVTGTGTPFLVLDCLVPAAVA
jgi:hypothetical protein